MSYLPHTEADRRAMLDVIGLKSQEDLYHMIPSGLKKTRLELADPLSELEVQREMTTLAAKNRSMVSFAGAGSYRRFIPSAVDAILSRSEFYTAYTPYQPEISQGTLQAIYEFQSMICLLTGMEVANASMYDGATATAEAALMAMRLTRRNKVLVSKTVHPEYREVIKTYLSGLGMNVEELDATDGMLTVDSFEATSEDAALVVAVPNFFGGLEAGKELAEKIHAAGGLFVVVAEPTSLGLLEAPAKYGADICVGDGQSFGSPMSFGGPSFGFMATTSKNARQLPGRIVGATVDTRGQRVFTLTLQTREQHIRREKATSNICSNQGLNALGATIYLSLVGKEGLKQVATMSLQGAHSLAERIDRLPGFKVKWNGFFNEFVVESSLPLERVFAEMEAKNILPGVKLGRFFPELKNCFLTCVTEANTPEELDRFVETLGAVAAPAVASR